MSISTDWRSLLSIEYSNNKFACELLDGHIRDGRYRIIDDIIYYKHRIYLVPESSLKKKIIQTSHDSPLLGHQGFLKTYRKIRERFSWKGVKGGIYAAHARMQHLSAEQGWAYPSSMVTLTTTNSKTKAGKYIRWLHYRVSQGPRERLLICHGWSTDQIIPFIFYLIQLLRSPGSRVTF